MLSAERTSHAVAVADAVAWAGMVRDEERRVARQGFGAGVILVNYAPELLAHRGDGARDVAESLLLDRVERSLTWTDRMAVIAPGRLGVLVLPIEDEQALVDRTRAIHRRLRSIGLDVDVVGANRTDNGGLPAAVARADAALDHAAIRRRTNS